MSGAQGALPPVQFLYFQLPGALSCLGPKLGIDSLRGCLVSRRLAGAAHKTDTTNFRFCNSWLRSVERLEVVVPGSVRTAGRPCGGQMQGLLPPDTCQRNSAHVVDWCICMQKEGPGNQGREMAVSKAAAGAEREHSCANAGFPFHARHQTPVNRTRGENRLFLTFIASTAWAPQPIQAATSLRIAPDTATAAPLVLQSSTRQCI